jgi:hypothetical protein
MTDGFNTMIKMAVQSAVKLAYCDYIAQTIQKNIKANDTEKFISSVGRVQFDLDENGSFRSTKKKIQVEDRQGKKYLITVEEMV